MAPDVATIERLEDRPITVEPAAIEAEFERIWRETAGPGADASSIRLRVLSFIGVADGAAGRDAFEELMMLLPQRNPCRGIVAVLGDGATEVEATLSAHCWRAPNGSRHVCSEEVQLAAPSAQDRALASLLRPLLVPEVPVVAWIIGGASHTTAVAQAAMAAAGRVFVDTAVLGDPAAALKSALGAMEAHDCVVADLAWGRLITWRELVAQFFDGSEGERQLGTIQSIEIESGRGVAASDSVLLAGWFVSVLGLAVADIEMTAGRLRTTLYRGSTGVTLSVAPGAGGDGLAEVRVKTGDALLTLQHHAESAHMHVIETWPDGPVRRTVEGLPVDDASVIARSLDDDADSAMFESAARSALALLSPG